MRSLTRDVLGLVFLVVLSTALPNCKLLREEEEAPNKPAEVTWRTDTDLDVKNDFTSHFTLQFEKDEPGFLSIRGQNNVDIEVNGERYNTKKPIAIDLRDKLLATPIAVFHEQELPSDRAPEIDLELEMKLTIASTKVETRAPAHGCRYAFVYIFQQIEAGPVLFPGEKAKDLEPRSAPRAVAWVHYASDGQLAMLPVGDGTVRDVDWIALTKSEEKGEHTCHYENGSHTIRLVHRDVTVYDRVSGKEVRKRSFAPQAKCRSTAFGASSQAKADLEDVEKWLTTLTKKNSAASTTADSVDRQIEGRLVDIAHEQRFANQGAVERVGHIIGGHGDRRIR